jgi:hypothetical protein
MSTRVLRSVLLAAFTLTAAACGSEAPAPDEHAGHVPGDEAATSSVSRVFFVQPKDGDTISTMATFEFGVENVTIDAVPPGDLTEADVRPGILHHHLGVDTDCLPPGTEIPKAEPWIHFGDGTNTIEMVLAPGEHKLALLAGDDLHRAIEGLCEVITVTVVE